MTRGRLGIRYVFFGLAFLMWMINQTTISTIVFVITGLSLSAGVFEQRAERRRDRDDL